MVTRDLRFNIFANDRASDAFARASAAAELLANRIARLDGKRARVRVEADTTDLEAKLARAEAELEKLNRKKINPKIDADIAATELKINTVTRELEELARRRTDPKIGADISAATTKITQLQKYIDGLKRDNSVRITAETEAARSKMIELQRRISDLKGSRTRIDAETGVAQNQVVNLQTLIAGMKSDNDIKFSAETEAARTKMLALQKQVAELTRDHSARIDADTEAARTKIIELEDRIEYLGTKESTPKIDADIAAAYAKIEQLRDRLRELAVAKNNPKINADVSRAEAEIQRLAMHIRDLNDKRNNPKLDANIAAAEAKVEKLEAKIAALEASRNSPKINADIAAAEAEIEKLRDKMRLLSAEESNPKIDADIAAAEAKIIQLQRQIDSLEDSRGPRLDAETAAATAKLTALRKLLEDLKNEKASPEVDAQIAAAEAKIARITGELDQLREDGVMVPINADTTSLERKLAKAQERLTDLQRYRPNIDIDADIAGALANIETLEDELRELANRRVSPEIRLRTEQATARLGELEADLARLSSRAASPAVNLQSALVRNQIAAVKEELRQLETMSANPTVDVEINRAQAEIAALRAQIAELDKMRATPRIDADVAKASARIAFLQAQIDRVRGRNTVSFDTNGALGGINSVLGALNQMRRSTQQSINNVGMLSRNLRQLTAPIGLTSLVPTLTSLGMSIQDAAAAFYLLPAAAGFAAAAIGTLSIAFSGLTDAIGPRDTAAQIKKADLAMERLGENAAAVARKVIDLKDEWNGLKSAVQDAFFERMAGVLQRLSDQYLPVLTKGFRGIAEEFNVIAGNMAIFLTDARQVDDTTRMFNMFGQTVEALGPGLMNVVAAFFDLGTVGASFLPGLAQGFENVTGRFREFIATAREDGSLQVWIAQGIVAMAEFGSLIGNIGGILGAMFDASAKSGASFLSSMVVLTAEVENFLKTGEGQAGLIALFQGIREAIDAMLPGIRIFFSSVADAIAVFQPAFGAVGEAFSAFSAALSPTIVMLAALARDVLIPLSAGFVGLAGVIGPVAPMVITLAVAFKAFTGIAAVILGVGAAIKGLATTVGIAALAIGASGTAAQGAANGVSRLGDMVSRVGNSLPLIGAALIAGWAIWDSSRSKAEEYATAVTRGASTVEEAIQQEVSQLEKRDFWFAQSKEYELDGDANRRAEAERNVTDALRDQLGQMDPLARAKAEVNIAESNYLEILERLGPAHSETTAALDILQGARGRANTETQKSTDLTRSNTDAIIANAQEVMAAANADVALERANLRLEEQQRRTTDALKEHGAESIEGRNATLDLRSAYLDAASAAGSKAQADAEARGEADAAEQGARVYEETLISLAGTAEGPVRDALVTAIANLKGTKDGSNDAAIAAAGLTEDIKKVPSTVTTTYSAPGLTKVQEDVGRLGNSVLALKDKSFRILATGEVIGKGMTGLATGGIMPGYTPGRDVHIAALSGGEAVMRPEWTRAVGADYVMAANAAARQGGIPAVKKFVQAGGNTMHEYAVGGIVNRAVTMPSTYTQKGPSIEAWAANVEKMFLANVQAAIKKAQETANFLGTAQGASGVNWMMNVLRGRFPGLQLISGFRPGAITATGNPSYHGQGRAVDLPPRIDVFNWIKNTYGATTKELIYSPAGGRQVHNGSNHTYTGVTKSMHYDHVHWAYDKGGMAKGRGWMFKDTIKPERVLSPEMTETFNNFVNGLQQAKRGGFSNLPYASPVGPGGMAPQPTPRPVVRLNLQPLLQAISALRSELLSRPQQVITQNIDGSRSPVETGHNAVLALKLCR